MLTHHAALPSRRTRAGSASALLRWAVAVLALCVGIQTLAWSALRILGPAHHHRQLAATGMAPNEMGHPGHQHAHRRMPALVARLLQGPADGYRPRSFGADEGDVERQSAEHLQAPDDPHLAVAHHVHDARDASVVFVAEDGRSASFVPLLAAAQSVHELDSLVPSMRPPPHAGFAQPRSVTGPTSFRSQVTLPLERPPHG